MNADTRVALSWVRRRGLLLVALVLPAAVAEAAGAETLARREWTIGGVAREGLLYAPATARSQPAAVVFAFHGHGGTARQASRSFPMHQVMPEAIVVYLQGLPTPVALTDPEGKRSGWQLTAGTQGDRDLKFFDEVLASVRREFRVDDRRIYSTGHSNGGAFTYLLWAVRGEVFAAVAPSAAVITVDAPKLTPKPVLHLAGRNDDLVKFAWQEAMIAKLKRLNQVGAGQPWEKVCTLYPSPLATPVVTFLHDGAHRYPAEGPALIAKFFRQHRRP